MGTHPIFESDFDCLTDFRRNNEKCEQNSTMLSNGNNSAHDGDTEALKSDQHNQDARNVHYESTPTLLYPIMSLILCFPIGLIACFFYQLAVDSFNQNQVIKSIRYARQAKRYSQISIVSGTIIHLFLLYFFMFKVLSSGLVSSSNGTSNGTASI